MVVIHFCTVNFIGCIVESCVDNATQSYCIDYLCFSITHKHVFIDLGLGGPGSKLRQDAEPLLACRVDAFLLDAKALKHQYEGALENALKAVYEAAQRRREAQRQMQDLESWSAVLRRPHERAD